MVSNMAVKKRRVRKVVVADDAIANEKYELVTVGRLKTHPDNPRKGNVELIRGLIRENKFFGVVIVQKSTRYILKGNHAFLAAKAEGLKRVPAVWLDVDDERAKKIMLADNKASDAASYDDQILVDLLKSTDDLVGTGFDDKELESLMRKLEAPPRGGPPVGSLTSHNAESKTVPLYMNNEDYAEFMEWVRQIGDTVEGLEHVTDVVRYAVKQTVNGL